MREYQAMLLDLDDTLYRYDSAHQAGMDKVYHYLTSEWHWQQEVIQTAYDQARLSIHQRLDGTAAMHHRLLYMQRCCELLGINAMIYAPVLTEHYWGAFLDAMRVDEDACRFIHQWRGHNKQICLLTDLVADIQFKKIAALGLQDKIDYMVTSEEAGAEKPSAAMFHLALEKLKLSNREVVMLGDHFEKDYQGARGQGIAAYWISEKPQEREGIKSVTFSELLESIT